MSFLRLLLTEFGPARTRLLLFIGLSGAAMGIVMTLVNTVSDLQPGQDPDFRTLVLFVIATVIVLWSRAQALRLTAIVCEAMADRLRRRFAALARRADLLGLEELGPANVASIVARDTATLSEATPQIVQAGVPVVAFVVSAFYIATLSPLAFVVVLALMTVNTLAVRRVQRFMPQLQAVARRAEGAFFQCFDHLLGGRKEVRMSAARGDDLELSHLAPLSEAVAAARIDSAARANRAVSVSMATFYVMLGAVAFALPQHLPDVQTALKVLYALIFMYSSVEVFVRALPTLARAESAIRGLEETEARLAAVAGTEEGPVAEPRPTFRLIEFRELAFAYPAVDGSAFVLGPLHLVLRPGEVVLVTGGNGSGKSTLLKLLTRLYRPSEGAIVWDDRLVEARNVADYRNLFAAAFHDFHLFDRLYGFDTADPAHVNAVLADLGLAGKTQYRDGRFTTLDLSAGQSKRLALAVALIEDRPIYILDEVAAEQDAAFRRRFYEELVPGLRARGRTVILASHDERYFRIADRRIHLEEGRMSEMEVA
jgi:putative ATP-binding cassette transporter